jgi:hypothetical protein
MSDILSVLLLVAAVVIAWVMIAAKDLFQEQEREREREHHHDT